MSGFVYNFLITDIKHLERKHHILAGIIIPLIAFGNMVMMVLVSNKLIEKSILKTSSHNPWVIGVVFVIVFILPAVIDKVRVSIQSNRKAVLVR
ncbi:hypothetical protein HZC32_00860 [Candidatus Woesearchaeota archaeon]|nr:hypothetical protein [Candidatus Woesearchaeota archaeon]